MPLLGDIFGAADAFKRSLADLMRNPLAAAQQRVGLLGDQANAARADLGLLADQNALRAQGSVMADAPMYRQAEDASRQRMFNALMNFAPVGATVWHGSPHKFDKFDASKIGTGEGNQAYGHGLYAAESPKTVLSPQTNYMQNERIYKRNSGGLNPFQEYISDLMDQGLKKEEAFGRMTGEGRKVAQMTKLQPGEAPFDAFAREWENVNGINTGNLYKVDLPDEAIAKMLDWDKPLSQQAPEVQKALDAVMQKRAAAAEAERLAMNEQYPARLTHPVLSKIASKPRTAFDYKGEAAVSALVQELGGPAKASEYLRAHGITGIRYLDGGSRSAGQGTSNYVVFPGNEGLLNILERNGKPIK